MSNVDIFITLKEWSSAAYKRNLHVEIIDGSYEDPFTHYYASTPDDKIRIGYFGHGNGADADYGIIAKDRGWYNVWINQ